jgi:hypothetical protein
MEALMLYQHHVAGKDTTNLWVLGVAVMLLLAVPMFLELWLAHRSTNGGEADDLRTR